MRRRRRGKKDDEEEVEKKNRNQGKKRRGGGRGRGGEEREEAVEYCIVFRASPYNYQLSVDVVYSHCSSYSSFLPHTLSLLRVVTGQAFLGCCVQPLFLLQLFLAPHTVVIKGCHGTGSPGMLCTAIVPPAAVYCPTLCRY